jgi:nucleotide-binding universal stress UspA family protein
MYRRILVVTDGTEESLVALREGALMARVHRAKVFLLVVEVRTAAMFLEGATSFLAAPEESRLADGLLRLSRLGVAAKGELRIGEPTVLINEAARDFAAELVVVGYRRRSFFDLWCSSVAGQRLADSVNCSVLLARNVLNDLDYDAKTGVAGQAV